MWTVDVSKAFYNAKLHAALHRFTGFRMAGDGADFSPPKNFFRPLFISTV
jgi:hypothetical protein